ncbi:MULTISPECIES: DUF6998 domain-containing protein [unclassified Cryobacterium]|uniref:DUF6998 domain-containing protein n=1 Tax=unclassified Cryobacterium TaxID=2649013 RepID=UPI002AB51DD7|nr:MULTISPECIES: hypothetical protein [unclassified Cryobacterium]MDY7528708.1 hypothetical protein [Cryobacterium sp. 10C2]MDY7555550.1 hypothetical protein [Cryobacterium sp. 10C3]MEB0203502.1 hypothetical protein [Cryobacterium sp. 5I3]MEB0287123.1 hypothetical protein [Cryobacterium sp. 10S3]MEB0292245.1 hypothetical protein [Cryobacterium sp. 10C2]
MNRDEFHASNLTSQELLQQYAGILGELRARGVIRTLNAPAGDLAETLTARAYRGELAPNSEKSWDVRAADGRLLQVKSRVIAASARSKPIQFSVFRSWDFDAAVFVAIAAESYGVLGAFEVPSEVVSARAGKASWVNGEIVTLSLTGLAALSDCIDVTTRLQNALESLDLPVSLAE